MMRTRLIWFGLRGRSVGLTSAGRNMKSRVFLLLVLTLCGCSDPVTLMYRKDPPRPSASLSLDPRRDLQLRERLPASGQVPSDQLLRLLRDLQEVSNWPPGLMVVRSVDVTCVSRVVDAESWLEEAEGWTYDPDSRVFTVATATHALDQPDAFGRPTASARVPLQARGSVLISIRFVSLSGGLSLTDLNAATTLSDFRASFPDGVQGSWSSTQTRGYYNGVTTPLNAAGNAVVNTTLQTAQAGVIVSALAARLPHGMARIDGTLTVSSFSGSSGVDQSQVTVPLQLDCERHTWERVFMIQGGNADATAAFKHWSQSTLGVDASDLAVFVRLD